MLSLILKDLLLAKKTLPFTALYGFFAIFVFAEALDTGNAAFSITVLAVGHMLITRAAYYEDKNKSESMIISLPVPRSQVVYAKYLAVFVYLFMGALSYCFAAVFISLFQIPWYVPPLSVMAAVGGAAGLLLISSVSLPILFKFGYIKTRMITMFLFLGAFFLPSILQGIQASEASWLSQLFRHFKGQSDTVLITYMLGFTAIIWAASITISLVLYERREF